MTPCHVEDNLYFRKASVSYKLCDLLIIKQLACPRAKSSQIFVYIWYIYICSFLNCSFLNCLNCVTRKLYITACNAMTHAMFTCSTNCVQSIAVPHILNSWVILKENSDIDSSSLIIIHCRQTNIMCGPHLQMITILCTLLLDCIVVVIT